MSWLWGGNETTEQAQLVISALQTEVDERDDKVKALTAALRREHQEYQALLTSEISELEDRKGKLQKELDEIDSIISSKQELLDAAGNEVKKKGSVKKKKSNGSVKSTPKSSTSQATAPSMSPKEESTKASKPKKKKKQKEGESTRSSSKEKPSKKKMEIPMDEALSKVAKKEPDVAFIIQRSNNTNTVVYAGRRHPDDSAKINPDKPLHVYWIMYEKAGHPTEELTVLERNSAYGVSYSESTMRPGDYNVVISSLKDRDNFLSLVDGKMRAITRINGKENMILQRVFVQMTSSWGIPSVAYIELFGVDPKTGEKVYEKKENK